MPEAPWRRRFRASRVSLPGWARDEPSRLLYLSNVSGRFEVYAWDLTADTHRQVTDRPEGTVACDIDPAGERIWWFDDDRGNEHGRWLIEPFGGGTPEPAAPALPAAYDAGLELGTRLAVIGSSDDDGVRVHTVRDGEADLLYEHREDASAVGLSRDERLVCLQHSEHGDSRHPALRVVTTDGETVGELWDGPGQALWGVGFSPVGGDPRFLAMHERRDLSRPVIWDASTGEEMDVDLDLPGEVGADWYPDGSALLVVHEHRGRSELYRYAIEDASLERIPTEPGVITSASARPDGEVWFRWTASHAPPVVRTHDRVVLEPPGDPAPGGVRYSDHVVQGVHCFLAEPDGERPHPTVFSVHGGPPANDADAFDPRVQAWVDHGFAVVCVNYRGSTGYGSAWRDAIQGKPGLTELEDIAAVHDWVIADGIADPARCVLEGASWGGYLTLLGLGTQTHRWSLGIADVPVADYVAAYADEMEPLKAFDRALFGGSPEEIPEEYERRSPITYAHLVGVPVFILVGENDPRCPARQVDNYIARLRELDASLEVYRYDAGHGSLVTDETIRQMELKLAFCAVTLGTPPPA